MHHLHAEKRQDKHVHLTQQNVHLTEQIMYISKVLTDNRTNTCTTDMLRRGRTNMYIWHDNLPCWQETGQMYTLLTCWQETEQIRSLLTCWHADKRLGKHVHCWRADKRGQTCTSDRTNMYTADMLTRDRTNMTTSLQRWQQKGQMQTMHSALLTGDRPNTFTITPPSPV